MQNFYGLSRNSIDEDVEYSIVKSGGRTPGTTLKSTGSGAHFTLALASSGNRMVGCLGVRCSPSAGKLYTHHIEK